MPKSNLKLPELKELLVRYQGELNKLDYQSGKIKSIISDLEGDINSLESKSISKLKAKTASKRKVGRPKKAEASTAAPKRRGRPPKAAAAVTKKKTASKPVVVKSKIFDSASTPTPAKKRGRPKKAVAETPAKPQVPVTKTDMGGYRLSEWDNFVLDTIKGKNKIVITKELIDQAPKYFKKPRLQETEIKNKLNRSLHKLANKRKAILKVPYEGRGHAYALPEWQSKTAGSIMKKYQI